MKSALLISLAIFLGAVSGCNRSGPDWVAQSRGAREKMVFERLTAQGIPERIAQLFRQVPREMFVPEAHYTNANKDLALGLSQVREIGAPSAMARFLTLANLAPYQKVLVLGTSGGFMEVLVRLIPAFVTVVDGNCPAVEESRKSAERYLETAHVDSKGSLTFVCDNPLDIRKIPDGKYDRILSLYSTGWLPGKWIDDLEPSGRILVVIGNPANGWLMMGDRGTTGLGWRKGPGVRGLPLAPDSPQNFYPQFAGDFAEPLIWPVKTDGSEKPTVPVAAIAEPPSDVPEAPKYDSDDAANETEVPDLKEIAGALSGQKHKARQVDVELPAETEPLRVRFSTTPATVKAGGKLDLMIKFERSSDKVKVPQYPSAYLKLDSVTEIGIVEEQKFKVREITRAEADAKGLGTSYYDTVPPITGTLKIPATAKPGRYPVQGTVFYFFCTSEDDAGYCAIRKEPVTFSIDIGS